MDEEKVNHSSSPGMLTNKTNTTVHMQQEQNIEKRNRDLMNKKVNRKINEDREIRRLITQHLSLFSEIRSL